eukprot:CAMPEP_0197268058 /NCGR_PEP_ID=MMETSP1432-20130617/3950_1 /TAXON_ID=44447 /ORGANISM="Pseudo-nitzschia delicatissima, Strain UNC1205" /LENGTH=459 /DNA_ID=CAMNT_0042733069 /DNA_START=163 /DNA_END=1542 /DNA_ORIENTATION=+
MSRNGYAPNGGNILVLYKIVNSKSDDDEGLFNCFNMPYGRGATLNSIKQHCVAAHSLSHLGPEGYHYRVMMEDKAGGGDRSFSWWDVQDGNANLPVKETSQYDLRKLLFPSKSTSSSTISSETATKAAKGAFKMMGKAMASVTGDEGATENHGPAVPVIVIKMLDLVKIQDEFTQKYGGGQAPVTPRRPRPRRTAPKSRNTAPTPARASRPTPARQARQAPAHRAPAASGNLMDFGDAPAAPPGRAMRHPTSAKPKNETRSQMLKRQQDERMRNENREWDDVEKRWKKVEPKNNAAATAPKKKEVGVKLDMSSAAGKSAKVQQAMQARVNEMNATQNKAVQEVKDREALKKKREQEEDAIRMQLEPKIKAWSEEYGKKKQLQALLASLHTILWPGTKWKTISMGDILQPAKVKKFYFKATLVVHPDKTGDLPAEQRFLAKRIFDALTQAKTAWDESLGR